MAACMKTGCPQAATHSLKIVVSDEDDPQVVSSEAFYPELKLCRTHVRHMKAAEFLASGGAALKAHLIRYAKADTTPDFSNPRAVALPLDDPEHQRVAAAMPRKPN